MINKADMDKWHCSVCDQECEPYRVHVYGEPGEDWFNVKHRIFRICAGCRVRLIGWLDGGKEDIR